MLSKYIKNLLKTQNRVIVPDLGAFLQKGDALKTIYFNEFLKFNDELLINFVAREEQIDITDAARLIKNFSNDVHGKLLIDRSVALEDIGTLYLDKNDKIQLRSGFNFSLLPDNAERLWKRHIRSFSLHETNGDKSKKEIARFVESEDFPETYDYNKKPAFEEKFQHNAPLPAHNRNESFIGAFSSKKIIYVFGLFLMLIAIAYFLFLQPSRDLRNQSNLLTDTMKVLSSETSRGESLNRGKLRNSKGININEMEARPNVMNDNKSVEVERRTEEKNTTKKAERELVRPNDSNKFFQKKTLASEMNLPDKKYYLIAGSFTLESNAQNLVKKLLAEGYKAEKIITDSGHIYVSYESFANKELASEEMKRIRALGIIGTWLLYY